MSKRYKAKLQFEHNPTPLSSSPSQSAQSRLVQKDVNVIDARETLERGRVNPAEEDVGAVRYLLQPFR